MSIHEIVGGTQWWLCATPLDAWPRGTAALAIRRLGSLPGKQAQKRVAGQCPPDRGAASIRAKDRIVAAASDGGAGPAPLGAWQVAQQLSGARPGGQVGLGDHAGRTVSHPSFHGLGGAPR